MNDIFVFRQDAQMTCPQQIMVFGKVFQQERPIDRSMLIVHEDYPLIAQMDLDGFRHGIIDRTKPLVSGCLADPHPYRLMRKSSDGYDEFLFDVSNHIRGNRQGYPKIVTIKPAIIYLPSGVELTSLGELKRVNIHVMPAEKLLDKSFFLDSILIEACQNKSFCDVN